MEKVTTDMHPNTIEVNRKQKAAAREAEGRAQDWLINSFPASFGQIEHRIYPLKLCIIDDIFEHLEQDTEAHISKTKIRQVVKRFVRQLDYLVSVKYRNPRINLDGHKVGQVTLQEAKQASEEIARRVQHNATRRYKKRPASVKSNKPLPVIRFKVRRRHSKCETTS